MMPALGAGDRVFVYRGACDMRRSFDRLAAMVEHELGLDPMRGDCFLFANRDGRMIKLLQWDGDGFAIWFKRLERGRFRLGDAETLGRARLAMILDGLHAEKIRQLPRYRKSPEKVRVTP